jgi:hypothetical protein
MRHLISILLLTISFTAFGQLKGVANYLDIDTLKGEDTVYVNLPTMTGVYLLSVEVLFEEVGGTSDGTGFFQGANDTIYQTLVSSPIFEANVNDTISISDGAFYTFKVAGTYNNNYRFALFGTAGDTTRVIPNYTIK